MSVAAPKPAEPGPDDFRRIAESIQKIADTGRALHASGLSRRALVVLLADATGLRRGDIGLILDALPKLRTYFLTKVV